MKAQILDLVQGSQEWLDVRKNHFCASEAPSVMSVNPYFPKNPRQLAQSKRGMVKTFVSHAMKEGHRLEPLIRQQVEDELEIGFMPTVMVQGKCLASLDGINFDGDVILEIKTTQSMNATVKAALAGRPSLPHQYQMQHQLMVSGADKCIYALRHPETEELILIDVFPDRLMQQKLQQAWKDFEPLMSCAETELRDFEPIPDDLKPWIDSYFEAKDNHQSAGQKLDIAKKQLMSELGGSGGWDGFSLRVREQSRKGSLDKAALLKSYPNINLADFEKKGTTFTVIEDLRK